MVTVSDKNAMKVFYYLMAADGEVCADEWERFDNIGYEISGDTYLKYRNSMINACMKHISSASIEDDYYTVILKGIDKALRSKSNAESKVIPIRLLVWNMLVMAFSNNDYSDVEKAVITHVVHATKMDRSVFLEMEHYMKTVAAVVRENERAQASDKPYAEVRPYVVELERRHKVILESATALIEDEFEDDELYIVDENRTIIDDTKAIIAPKVIPIATEIGKKTRILAGDAKKKLKETDFKDEATKLNYKFKGFMNDMQSKIK